jgi:hypothetical protein
MGTRSIATGVEHCQLRTAIEVLVPYNSAVAAETRIIDGRGDQLE